MAFKENFIKWFFECSWFLYEPKRPEIGNDLWEQLKNEYCNGFEKLF